MTAPQDPKSDTATPTGDAIKKSRAKTRIPTPQALADVALIDATTCAAAGCMSVSWWHARVAAGGAPQPAIREPRCTRWRLSDVLAYWAMRAQQGTDAAAADKVLDKAKRASAAAQAKRAAGAVAPGR